MTLMADEKPPVLTKIIATIGSPGTSSANVETLTRLIHAGASVFRLNFSHGELSEHKKTLALIRQVEQETGQPIGVLGDLSGPKIRVGKVVDGGIEVEAGEDIIFQREEIFADGPRFSTTLETLIDDIEVGQKLLINDGAIRTLVVEKDSEAGEITCRVVTGGIISTRKGINLPNTALSVEAITPRDWECVDWAIENKLDFLALSFVRSADEVERLKNKVVELCHALNRRPLPIVSKIEKPEALDNIHGILTASDVIMIARGDLGVEMDLAEVPVIQKSLIELARQYAKPTVVATQMLESMIENASPTRAEASDVANAILDQAGCLMLSGETAVGKHPIVTVDTMRRIATRTDFYLNERTDRFPSSFCRFKTDHWTDGLASGARQVVKDVDAKLIVAWSQSGRAAMYLSETRIPVPILACSDEMDTVRRITILRGVLPVYWREQPDSLDTFTRDMDAHILKQGWANVGDIVLFVAGSPIGLGGATNSLAVHTLGSTS